MWKRVFPDLLDITEEYQFCDYNALVLGPLVKLSLLIGGI